MLTLKGILCGEIKEGQRIVSELTGPNFPPANFTAGIAFVLGKRAGIHEERQRRKKGRA